MSLIFPPNTPETTSQVEGNRKEFDALTEQDLPDIKSIFLGWHPEKQRKFIQYLQDQIRHQSVLHITQTEMSEKIPQILALLQSL